MRKILLIVLLLIVGVNLFAQTILLSEKEELNLRNDDFMVVGKCRGYSVVYRNHASIGELLFYNKNMVKEKISTLSFLPSKLSKIKFTNTSQDMLVFYVVKENKSMNVYMSKLNQDYSWTEPQLFESTPMESFRNNGEFNFSVSDDNTKTLVYNSFSEEGSTKLHAKVVDINLQVDIEIKQLMTEGDLYMLDVAGVSNRGEAYLLANDTKANKGSGEKLILLTASKGDLNFSFNQFDLNQYSIRDIHLAIDNINRNLYIASYFSDGRYSKSRGLFLGSYNIENKIVNPSHFTPITMQVAATPTDLKDMKIRNLFLKKSGEVEIVAERTYQNTRSIASITPMLSSSMMMSNMNENARIVNEFSYDEIAVFNLKADGSLAWSQTILKDQTTMDDNGIFSSYGVLQHRLGNAYIFNDMSGKQSRILASYISGTGELTVKELQTSEEIENWNLMPRSALQMSKSEIVMPCVSKNYLCFLKISY